MRHQYSNIVPYETPTPYVHMHHLNRLTRLCYGIVKFNALKHVETDDEKFSVKSLSHMLRTHNN